VDAGVATVNSSDEDSGKILCTSSLFFCVSNDLCCSTVAAVCYSQHRHKYISAKYKYKIRKFNNWKNLQSC